MFVSLHTSKKISDVGEKAKNIYWMIQNGVNVPVTHVLTFGAQDEYLRDQNTFLKTVKIMLGDQLDMRKTFAVRSSANLEDSFQHSFAGQFTSFLDIQGVEDLLQAIQDVYKIHDSPSIKAYLEKTELDPQSIKMSVIIQEMVQPHVSGVVFSKNPLTSLDEIIVEAVKGSGEGLLKGGETPFRWVNKWGKWMVQPNNGPIDHEIIQEVVDKTQYVSKRFGSPVDLEWVHDGQNLFFVQLRPITQLDKINIYSNRISREVFPGLIKPLVWSVNVPLVNSAWIWLLTELIGQNSLKPDDLAKAFAYRAYFNMGVLGRVFSLLGMPKESLELLMGLEGGENKPRFRPSIKTLRYLPRMFSFLLRMIGYDRKLSPKLEKIKLEYAQLDIENVSELDDVSILNSIDKLYAINQKTAYHNIVVPLLMGIYNALFKIQLAKIGVDITTLNATYGMEKLWDYNPNIHIRYLAEQLNALDENTRSIFHECSYQQLLSHPDLAEFKSQISTFISRFGHLSDSGNDFSSKPWRESPDLVLQMINAEADRLKYTAARASNEEIFDEHPQLHPKSSRKIDNPENNSITWDDLDINYFRKLWMTPLYKRARRFQFYREMVSSIYTYGYGLFRVYFLELGTRLMREQWLDEAEDIFYISWDEVKRIFTSRRDEKAFFNGVPTQQIVADRKYDMSSKSDLILPEIIYGDDLPPYEKSHHNLEILKGIPSSKGYFQGPAKVISGMHEHHKLSAGDVLIIPFSDVSWTPLFTRVGAVIAESGGILSHSSIVAREYNLPCVVSVPGACQIPDHTVVSVNGYNGEVHLHPGE